MDNKTIYPQNSLVLLASHWSSSLALLDDLLREAPARFDIISLFSEMYFLHRLWYEVVSPRGSGRWDGQAGPPGLHTSPPATPAPPALTCPPNTPSAVNYPDAAVIVHSQSSCSEGPQFKNMTNVLLWELCLNLFHRPSFKSDDRENRCPQRCLH